MILRQIGLEWSQNNHKIEAPSSGGIFQQNNIAFGVAKVGAGTFRLPDDGLPQYVHATDTATIANASGVAVATLTAGQVELFLPMSSTTWFAMTASLRTTLLSTQGFIDLPLAGWREVTSNDITNAAGNGGILATDTTPAYEYVNGDADSQHRLLWAAGNSDAVTRQRALPPDMDRTQPIVLNVRGVRSQAGETVVIDVDTFFDEGDTKVEDVTVAFTGSTSTVTATIAAADIPSTAATMSVELTPNGNDTGTLAVYATYLTYTKKLLTS